MNPLEITIASISVFVVLLIFFRWRRSHEKAAGAAPRGLLLKPGECTTLSVNIPLDGSGATSCEVLPQAVPPKDVLDRVGGVAPDDFLRTSDILRCCAGLMDEAIKATPEDRVKLLIRTRNLTDYWFDVIGLNALREAGKVAGYEAQ